MTSAATAVSQFHLEDTTFTVHCAKQLFSPDWESTELREQVEVARETYRIYSPTIPCFDSYDEKSAVYAVQAQYPIEYQGELAQVTEWTTLRFVPAVGQPALSEDLKHYVVTDGADQQPLKECILKRLYDSQEQQLANIFTYSRFSACRPQAEVREQQWLVNAYWQASGIRTKNRWTAAAFALMNTAFLNDVNTRSSVPITLTAQINQKVEETVFLSALRKQQPSASVAFPLAYQVLGFSDSGAVHLNRAQYGHYFYQFPGYFFAVSELVPALTGLVSQGKLSVETLEKYVDVSWEQVTATGSYQHLNRLGELLTISGQIPGSALTGEQLRAHLDQIVGDGVQLRLLPQPVVQELCQLLLTTDSADSANTA